MMTLFRCIDYTIISLPTQLCALLTPLFVHQSFVCAHVCMCVQKSKDHFLESHLFSIHEIHDGTQVVRLVKAALLPSVIYCHAFFGNFNSQKIVHF